LGWSRLVDKVAIRLPDDAYFGSIGTWGACVPTQYMSCIPADGAIVRGDSFLVYFDNSYERIYEHFNFDSFDDLILLKNIRLAPGEHEAFAFLDGAIEWQPPSDVPSDVWVRGLRLIVGPMDWLAGTATSLPDIVSTFDPLCGCVPD
jgi:hypothetical protein